MLITSEELAIMEVMWKKNEVTFREILEDLGKELYDERKKIGILMKRLLIKKAIDVKKKGRTFYYMAIIKDDGYEELVINIK